MSTTMKLALGSVAVGLLVLGLKALAWWLTGSVALLSDALESTVNVATALAAVLAINVAARPADAGHPYGHHKAEFLSAVLEGVLIIVAALLILSEAWEGFRAPAPVETPLQGLLVSGLATAINLLWAQVILRQGRRERSPALLADGHHLMADVVTSVGVVAGVLLATLTGWWWLDPALAALVAVNVLWSGWRVMAESLSGLMDEAVPEATLRRIHAAISAAAEGAVEAHDLRTRHAGRVTFIDFHLIVPGETTVRDAHEICDRVEASLMAAVPDARVSIHVEPEHKAKHTGIVVMDHATRA
jgi:cation diffusion facilitator family transporter